MNIYSWYTKVYKQLNKMAPTKDSWRHFSFVPITEEISKYLVEDLERISKLSAMK